MHYEFIQTDEQIKLIKNIFKLIQKRNISSIYIYIAIKLEISRRNLFENETKKGKKNIGMVKNRVFSSY